MRVFREVIEGKRLGVKFRMRRKRRWRGGCLGKVRILEIDFY